jgi:hypothetical protein
MHRGPLPTSNNPFHSLFAIHFVVIGMEAEDLAAEIAVLDRRERTLIMELKDVLTDITTPDSSDVEDDEVEEVELPQVRAGLMRVEPLPRRWTEYSGLYESEDYRTKAKLKVRFAKNLIRTVHLGPLMMSLAFARSLERVELTYPDDGGRIGLNSLVAMYNIIIND